MLIYFTLARECMTINQLNSIHIRLENLICHFELLDIHCSLMSGAFDHFLMDDRVNIPGNLLPSWRSNLGKNWINRLYKSLPPKEAGLDQDFYRIEFSPLINAYSAGGDPSAKTLVSPP